MSLAHPTFESLEARQLLAAGIDLVADHGVRPTETLTAGGVTYFLGQDRAHGRELWRSDGTRAGSRMSSTWCPADTIHT